MSKLKRPMSAEQVIESVAIISGKPVDVALDRGIKGAIVGIFDSLVGSRESRNSLLFRLFPGKWMLYDAVSSKDLSESEWYALKRWVGPNKPEGEKWQGTADFITECARLNFHFDISPSGKRILEGQEHLSENSFFAEFCVGRFGCIPVMGCGCKANSLTALFNPFCIDHADGGSNKEAYIIQADIPLEEGVDDNG